MGWRLAGEDGIDVGMEGVREQFSWEEVWSWGFMTTDRTRRCEREGGGGVG